MSERPMTRDRQRHRAARSGRRFRGFTLIELMVAMLLGLIVIGGVTSVFLAGQQTYRTNEALGDVGDSSRIAFELLARDIRDAGLSGCDNSNGRIANVLNNTTLWYTDWNDALVGYDDASTDPALTGLSTGVPVAGTSSVHVLSTAATDVSVTWSASGGSGSPANLKINAATSQLSTGQLIMVCDYDHATIMQITDYSGNQVVVHNTGNKVSPGNCTKGVGYPPLCTANGTTYSFANNSRIAVLTAVDWYIGTNPLGGKSLYRLSVAYGASGAASGTPQEMVRNVTNMKISYLQPTSSGPGTAFGNAASVTNWAAVDAAQIQLTVNSANPRASVNNGAPLQRIFTSTTTVRNRVQ